MRAGILPGPAGFPDRSAAEPGSLLSPDPEGGGGGIIGFPFGIDGAAWTLGQAQDSATRMSDQQEGGSRELDVIRSVRGRGSLAKLAAYTRLSGPGWLQAAITLGGGSLASSLYLGVLAGYGMLWLQPFAMALGVAMLSCIAFVTLSTGERPFQAIKNHINPVLAWAWLLASLLANMVWSLPQFSLATGVLEQNLGLFSGTSASGRPPSRYSS